MHVLAEATRLSWIFGRLFKKAERTLGGGAGARVGWPAPVLGPPTSPDQSTDKYCVCFEGLS